MGDYTQLCFKERRQIYMFLSMGEVGDDLPPIWWTLPSEKGWVITLNTYKH